MHNNSKPPYRPIGPTSRDLMLKPGYRSNIVPAKNALNNAQSSAANSPPTTSNDSPASTEEKPILPFPYPSKFLFKVKDLEFSPSVRYHKMSNEDELNLRRVGTCFIKQLTSRINANIKKKSYMISARATSMAMIYFHRFYMYHSLVSFLPMEMATACLFLAAKNENCPKPVACFSQYYYRLTHNDDRLEEDEIETVNDLIRAYESRLIQTLAFEFRIELPHIVVINAPFYSEGDCLKKTAWRFCTDILAYTTLCLQYDENVLAAVVFYAAGAYLNINMRKQFGANWVRSLSPILSDDILIKIVNVFIDALREMNTIIHSKKYELEEGEIV